MVAGCAGLSDFAPATVAPAARTARPIFDLSARMAASDGQHASSGTVDWTHTPVLDSMDFKGPLGQIAGRIRSQPGLSVLTLANGSSREAATPGQLAHDLLGVPVPLDGLAAWVQAVPRRGATVRRTDGFGRPASVSDAGWVIDYLAYESDDAQALPRRLDARWGDAFLKLVIDRWQIQ
jgi:outer membrane lipoprotein LolB